MIDQRSAVDPGDRAAWAAPGRGAGAPSLIQILVLVVALCFVSGVVGWWVGQPSEERFNAVDVGFLTDMSTHHDGALALGFAYLGHGGDQLVGHFAREIVVDQSREVGLMNGLLDDAGEQDAPVDGIAMAWMGMAVRPAEMPGMATQAELDQVRAANGALADDLFTRLMILHHAAGAEMADYAVAHGDNDRVQRLAEAMARVQRVEINELNQRRQVLGLTLVTPPGALDEGHSHG